MSAEQTMPADKNYHAMSEDSSVQSADLARSSVVAPPAVNMGTATPPPAAFSYGLFACEDDMGLCCDVGWCTPCFLGRTHNAIMKNEPNSTNVGVCMGVSAAAFIGCAGCVFVNFGLGLAPLGGLVCQMGSIPYTYVVCQQRKEMRRHLNMQENDCEDCLVSWYCGNCVQCQVTREANKLGMQPGTICCCNKPQPVVHTVPQELIQPAYQAPTEVE